MLARLLQAALSPRSLRGSTPAMARWMACPHGAQRAMAPLSQTPGDVSASPCTRELPRHSNASWRQSSPSSWRPGSSTAMAAQASPLAGPHSCSMEWSPGQSAQRGQSAAPDVLPLGPLKPLFTRPATVPGAAQRSCPALAAHSAHSSLLSPQSLSRCPTACVWSRSGERQWGARPEHIQSATASPEQGTTALASARQRRLSVALKPTAEAKAVGGPQCPSNRWERNCIPAVGGPQWQGTTALAWSPSHCRHAGLLPLRQPPAVLPAVRPVLLDPTVQLSSLPGTRGVICAIGSSSAGRGLQGAHEEWAPRPGIRSLSSPREGSPGRVKSSLSAPREWASGASAHMASGVASSAPAPAAAVEEGSVPQLAATVLLEDDLKSLMLDHAFEESVSADAQLLLSQCWPIIRQRLEQHGGQRWEEEEGGEEDEEEELSEGEGAINRGADETVEDSVAGVLPERVELSEGEGAVAMGIDEGVGDGVAGVVPERVELSVLLCSDSYIQSLNAQWRSVDKPTDVLSFPQMQPLGLTPTLLLGDIIISVETAERQAAERGHTLRDEIRILMVHGLLHLLGLEHEEGGEAERAMQEEEARVLSLLGWHVEGLIASAARADAASLPTGRSPHRAWKPPFRLLLCDMDGTLLNSRSKISPCTAEALRAASAKGVQVAIATGKARPAAMAAMATVGLAGDEGVISHRSPGVFIQGLRVYGEGGTVVHNALLPVHVVAQAFDFSLEHGLALVGFSGDHCVTLRDHPLVEALHTVYYEPRARVCSSIDEILNESPVQKLLFFDTEQGVNEFIRPYWSKHLSIDEAALTVAVPGMLEILPPGESKGSGVKILLDSMGIHPDDVMALGDGENDKEMIEMVGWGVAMGNGSPITKAVAKAVVGSNDDGGIAEAIDRFILS